MSTLQENKSFEIPESLRIQLVGLRRYLAKVKIGFASLLCLGSFLGASLLIFISDRVTDTSAAIRLSLFALTLASAIAIPIAAYRWLWKLRTNYQISKWLRRRDKSIGDRLMGAIELSESTGEQGRSPKLVHAALRQVATKTSQLDLTTYVSNDQNRWAARTVAFLAVCVGILAGTVPSGLFNAVARLSLPWSSVPRYTFTAVEPVASPLAVPFGEPFEIVAHLKETSVWKPTQGKATSKVPSGRSDTASLSKPVTASVSAVLEEYRFQFEFPSESSEKQILLSIGDYRQSIQLLPVHRPEIVKVEAIIQLPEYLQRSGPSMVEDVRRGAIDILQGSQVRFLALTSQPIASSSLEQPSTKTSLAVEIDRNKMVSESFAVSDTNHELKWTWKDTNGFDGKKPLHLNCNSILDNPPATSIQGLAAQQVLLNSEQLNFQILSNDDYGVKSIGLSWKTAPGTESETPSLERAQVLKEGGPHSSQLEALGSFRPLDHGIESGVVELHAWGVDFFPQRPPANSAPATILVLTADQHSQWVTNQLNQWQQSALEVRDRELQILDKNKALLQNVNQSDVKVDLDQMLKDQSRDEMANAKRLETIAATGENLLKIAAKNESIGVGHLEKWAEMQQVLSSLSKKKMPEVANLLRKAAEAKNTKGPKLNTEESSKPTQKSSGAPPDSNSSEDKPQQNNTKQPKISLPQTTVTGPPTESKDPNDLRTVQNAQQELTAEAIAAQEKLLAEFELLAEEMNSILGNLEASTFVKRLKAASRAQDKIADSLRESLKVQFSSSIDNRNSETHSSSPSIESLLTASSQQAKAAGADLANIVDDMDAFFERRRTDGLQMVLNDIRETKAVAAVNRLSDELAIEQGMSVAQSEFWADTIDRWSEELIDPACKGNCPGSKSSDSLPPSVVLESLRLLESQVALREQTRVADQRIQSISELEHKQDGERLAILQDQLDDKANDILLRISELPNGTSTFENEVRLFEQVSAWMVDSANRLRTPDTGRAEIAVQTEIIEALLKSKRINPKGGGGGSGGSPGGGGKGDAVDSALALLGIGTNLREVRETREVEQSTGSTGNVLPQEYRKGLDEYFFQLEQNRSRMKGDE